jgi:hypothetical protein
MLKPRDGGFLEPVRMEIRHARDLTEFFDGPFPVGDRRLQFAIPEKNGSRALPSMSLRSLIASCATLGREHPTGVPVSIVHKNTAPPTSQSRSMLTASPIRRPEYRSKRINARSRFGLRADDSVISRFQPESFPSPHRKMAAWVLAPLRVLQCPRRILGTPFPFNAVFEKRARVVPFYS